MIEITTGLYDPETKTYKTGTSIERLKTRRGELLVQSIPVPPDEELTKEYEPASLEYVKKKAAELEEKEKALEEANQTIKVLKREVLDLATNILPHAMFQLGLNIIGIDGSNKVVEVEPLITATLPKENEEARKKAIDWVRANKLGGNIKYSLEVDFVKGDEATMKAVVEAIKAIDLNLNPRIEETIHHKTYECVVRRVVESSYDTGKIVPADILNAYISNIAKVK